MAEFTPTETLYDRAVANGEAYRVSKRHTLADGEQLTLYINPTSSGGTVFIETPAITTPANCDIDVWENPDPGTNTVDDFLVHAMRYDVSPESPDAEVLRVSDGGLDTSGGDKTEETRVQSSEQYNTPGGESRRGLWRVVPVGESIAMVVTDRSNGSGNVYGFDTVVYEGSVFPG